MSVLKELLSKIVNESADWIVLSYQNQKDFNQLWFPDSNQLLANNVLIVWDGMPPSDTHGINIFDHLTPYDWALSYSHYLLDNPQNKKPELKIYILDIHQQNYPNAFSVRMLPAICHVMPHLGAYSLSASSNPHFKSIDQLIDDVAKTPKSSLKDAKLDEVKSMSHSWFASVANSTSHHDVSNILGPMVLSAAFTNKANAESASTADALLNKLKFIGIDYKDADKKDKWFDKPNEGFFKGQPINVYLLDDQANQGWLDFLCQAFGVQANVSMKASEEFKLYGSLPNEVNIYGSNNARALLERIEKAEKDSRFQFNLDDHLGGNALEVLFLDLRLATSEIEERAFFKEALRIAETKETNIDGLENLNEAMENAQSWGLFKKDMAYIELLTLLPRIVAILDFSLPIVIFSSSGQRRITELLKPYENIVTVFEKPRFFSYINAEIFTNTEYCFKQALQQLLKLLRARLTAQTLMDSYKFERFNINSVDSNYYYVEFYCDETNVKDDNGLITGMKVGGCLAIFSAESKESAINKSYLFDDALVKNGVQYFDDLGVTNRLPKNKSVKGKKGSFKTELVNALKDDENAPIFLGYVGLTGTNGNGNGNDIGDSADRLYKATVTALLELILYEVIPNLINTNTTLGVDFSAIVATKIKYFTKENQFWFEKAKYKYGLGGVQSKDGSYRLNSMSRDGVYSILSDLHELRPQKLVTIERAVASQLCYEKGAKVISKPRFFICTSCKTVVESQSYIMPSLDFKIAKLKRLPEGKKFGFFEILNDGRIDVFAHKATGWEGFENANIGDCFIFKREGINPNGQSFIEMLSPATEDQVKIVDDARKILNPVTLNCLCQNADDKQFRPDHRALHYLADELLNDIAKTNSVYINNNDTKISVLFDDLFNEDFNVLRQIGRDIDAGHVSDALASTCNLFNKNAKGYVYRGGSKFILSKLSSRLKMITPKDYWDSIK